MRVLLQGDTRIRVDGRGEGLRVEAEEAGPGFSPLHMLAASLATCTYALLLSWAHAADLDHGDLAIDTEWDYREDPHRIGRFDLTLDWRSLPPSRHEAALRVAAECTVEHTLSVPPTIEIRIAG